MTKQLGTLQHRRIRQICKHGDALVVLHRYREALELYRQARELLPSPFHEWEDAAAVIASQGDALFRLEHYPEALEAFLDAATCPNGSSNAFVNLRLGQCHFELGHLEASAQRLNTAASLAGESIFQEEDPKYREFLATTAGSVTAAGARN